ncbi:MAG: hypothetical protein HC906_12560, partial [Bacteroidales bacterium]|nr:hypothetical protein [Bacteroidales bacterium]
MIFFYMDYNQTTPGTEWKWIGITQDRAQHPDDPRNFHEGQIHNHCSPFIAKVNGHTIMMVSGQHGFTPYVYLLEQGIAVNRYYHNYLGGSYIMDSKANIWEATDEGIFITPFLNVASDNSLMYGKTYKYSEFTIG